MRDENGRFVAGRPAENRYPVGTVRIRTRHKRNKERRAYIKIAEPNTWILRARYVWRQYNGPIPPNMGVHHKDGDKLNDSIENLELVSKRKHLAIHREEFQEKATANFTKTRRKRRWSTKSKNKRTGRPPTWGEKQMKDAVAAYLNGEGTYKEIAERFGILSSALGNRVRRERSV